MIKSWLTRQMKWRLPLWVRGRGWKKHRVNEATTSKGMKQRNGEKQLFICNGEMKPNLSGCLFLNRNSITQGINIVKFLLKELNCIIIFEAWLRHKWNIFDNILKTNGNYLPESLYYCKIQALGWQNLFVTLVPNRYVIISSQNNIFK